MKTYTLIGGVNGAGKSSLTGSLRSERSDLGIVVDPDKLTVQCGGDEYEGGKLEGNVTCNNDQLEYYYTETSEAEYRAYRQKLAEQENSQALLKDSDPEMREMAKEELARDQERADRKAEEVANLERKT